jgi:hypothetical protein
MVPIFIDSNNSLPNWLVVPLLLSMGIFVIYLIWDERHNG